MNLNLTLTMKFIHVGLHMRVMYSILFMKNKKIAGIVGGVWKNGIL